MRAAKQRRSADDDVDRLQCEGKRIRRRRKMKKTFVIKDAGPPCYSGVPGPGRQVAAARATQRKHRRRPASATIFDPTRLGPMPRALSTFRPSANSDSGALGQAAAGLSRLLQHLG